MVDSVVIEGSYGVARLEGLSVNTTVTFKVPIQLTTLPHFFLGIEWTTSGTPATPGAGTVTSVKLESITSPGVFEAMPDGESIDATTGSALARLSAAGNFSRVQIITTGITTADGMTVRLSANRS